MLFANHDKFMHSLMLSTLAANPSTVSVLNLENNRATELNSSSITVLTRNLPANLLTLLLHPPPAIPQFQLLVVFFFSLIHPTVSFSRQRFYISLTAIKHHNN